MMSIFVFLLHLCIAQIVTSRTRENIARYKIANQSTPLVYAPPKEIAYRWKAGFAIDGKRKYINDMGRTCSASGYERTEKGPWWELDLGEVYSLGRIDVYGRHDLAGVRQLGGFKLSLSETTRYVNSTDDPVYTNPTPTGKYLPNEGLTTVILGGMSARYVAISLNRYTPPQKTLMVICEVEIFEACENGEFEPDCAACHCQHDYCNKTTGQCPVGGCQSGWMGTACDTECKKSTFGPNCTHRCEQCKNGKCDRFTGQCTVGCKKGYMGMFCNESCPAGKYGWNCNRTCGHCLDDGTCTRFNGTCAGGLCDAGYEGDRCKQGCPADKYGRNCKHTCGHCLDDGTCNRFNGTCVGGLCDAGYDGHRCQHDCTAGTYGQKCANTCGHCQHKPCHHVNGTCDGRRCEAGYLGLKCDQACPHGMYGKDCTSQCGHCLHNPCNHENGTCDTRGCEAGYYGPRCEQACDAGYYGKNCTETCGHCSNPNTCNVTSGHCEQGCEIGYQGNFCKEKCRFGFHGVECKSVCGYCLHNETCDHQHGTCFSGCAPGYKDNLCEKSCSAGTFGINCVNTCGKCRSVSECNITNGHCISDCQRGFKGPYCNETCTAGKFGVNCAHECGKCRAENECDSVHGQCKGGCLPGYRGSFCNETCSAGTFGSNCDQKCGNCRNNTVCNTVNGQCEDGCQPGYRGDFCNVTCEAGSFGQDCGQECGHCLEGSNSCSIFDGRCDGDCKAGYMGDLCKTPCTVGTFGINCDHKCGQCRTIKGCKSDSGHCIEGCQPGYKKPLCNETCSGGSYGENCVESCGKCVDDATCNYVNGTCDGGCQHGYEAPLCSKECREGSYGRNCEEKCGECSEGTVCDVFTGICDHHCQPGYYPPYCRDACTEGTFGVNCSEECGFCSQNLTCDHVSGFCGSDCMPGYHGDTCTSILAQTSSEQGNSPGLVIGLIAAVLSLLGFVLIIMRTRRQRNKGRTEHETTVVSWDRLEHDGGGMTNDNDMGNDMVMDSMRAGTMATAGPSDQAAVGDVWSSEPVYSAPNKAANDEKLIPVHRLWDFIDQQTAGNKEKLTSEFQTLKNGLLYPHEVGSREENKVKHKYKLMFAYDHNRVQLQITQPGETDYINASIIDGVDRTGKFIASQGPIKAMIDDFWRMIWQQHTTIVVMLTNLVESGKLKCIQYWPEKGQALIFGLVKVVLKSVDNFRDYDVRRMQVTYNKTVSRQVTHYHFKSWPDKDVPINAFCLVNFWRVVDLAASSVNNAPILVHCSAGVGRTGTFIALDNAYYQGRRKGGINPLGIVTSLREQRMTMVQTRDQYVYLYKTAAEALLFGTDYISVTQFDEVFNYMTQRNRLEKQFQLIQKSIEDQLSEEDSVYANVAGAIGSVGRQQHQVEPVFVKNFEKRNTFVLCNFSSQFDMEKAWKTVLGYNPVTVVTLPEQPPTHQKDAAEFFGQRTPVNLPVAMVGESLKGSHTERSFEISGVSSTTLKIFEFISWDADSTTPYHTRPVLDLVRAIRAWQPTSSDETPIVIMCSDGCTRSGLICVLLNEIERLESKNGQTNLVHTVKSMKATRPEIIPIYDQYRFCIDALLAYITKSDDIYGNV